MRSKLHILDISFNQLKDDGALELSQALKFNKSLTTLHIQENDINMQGGALLLESIMENYTLQTLSADGNLFYLRYVDRIKHYLTRNQRLSKDHILPGLLKD